MFPLYELVHFPWRPEPPPPKSAAIRHLGSGLCLEACADDNSVKLQHFDGNHKQIWTLFPVDEDNPDHGFHLQCVAADWNMLDSVRSHDINRELTVYSVAGSSSQDWNINPDHTFTNDGTNLAIDIFEGNCIPGQTLMLSERHGGYTQQFELLYQDITEEELVPVHLRCSFFSPCVVPK